MRIWALTLIAVLFVLSIVNAQETINIGGAEVPVIQGAISTQSTVQAKQLRIVIYTTEASLESVVMFYESYLKNNEYIIIGGQKGDEYNAACKKGSAMFTLRIYAQSGKTIIQFIW